MIPMTPRTVDRIITKFLCCVDMPDAAVVTGVIGIDVIARVGLGSGPARTGVFMEAEIVEVVKKSELKVDDDEGKRKVETTKVVVTVDD
jgi:hypothetical protein